MLNACSFTSVHLVIEVGLVEFVDCSWLTFSLQSQIVLTIRVFRPVVLSVEIT